MSSLTAKAIERLLNRGRIINLTAATLTATNDVHGDKTVTVNAAAGSTITLPAANGLGTRLRFVVGTTVTSNNLIIQAASAADTLTGIALIAQDAANTTVAFETASTSDTVTMNGTTKGGLKGNIIELEDIAPGVWSINITGAATGTEATPFIASV